MKRDYFSKPLQGGSRSSQDYGHTKLEPQARPSIIEPWAGWLAVIVISYFLWQFVR